MTPTHSAAAFALASWFGCGRAPKAPGTVGSIGAVPLHLLLRLLPLPVHAAVVLGLTAGGIWSAGRVATELNESDPQSIVIDEVVGTLIAMGLVRRRSALRQLAALVVFRAIDIAKPGPVSTAERLKPVGLGIMADDLLAGLIAGAVTRWVR